MGSIFKDISKLSFDYVPEKLVHRDRQLTRLHTLFDPILESNYSQSAFITGGVGTGKTASTKLFCKEMQDAAARKQVGFKYVLVNCRHRSTDASVLLKVLQGFDPGFPDRGFSITEMLDSLRKHLEKRNLHLFIVLDEADVLLKKGTDLVYNFSRFGEEYMSGRQAVSMVLISQKHVLDYMDPSSLSTFKRGNIIQFDRYTAEELNDILTQRRELACQPDTVPDEAVELMSDIASEWGDARFAIELLEKAGMLAEEEARAEVTAEDVRAAKAVTHSEIDASKLNELDQSRLLVLLASAQCLRKHAYTQTGMVEKQYLSLCEAYEIEARGHTQFWKYLKDLDARGLIVSKAVSGAEGTTTKISLPDIPVKELEQKLTQMIEGK